MVSYFIFNPILKKASMKKLPLLFFLGMGSLVSNAQSLSPEVISSSGDFHESSAGSLSWTIGEPISETYTSTDYQLTQGFHQTKFTIVGLEEHPKSLFDVNVFPNPAIEYFEIDLNQVDLTGEFQYEFYDQNGRVHHSGLITNTKTKIELNGLANSIYFLKVWSDTENYHKIYQVLKIK